MQWRCVPLLKIMLAVRSTMLRIRIIAYVSSSYGTCHSACRKWQKLDQELPINCTASSDESSCQTHVVSSQMARMLLSLMKAGCEMQTEGHNV